MLTYPNLHFVPLFNIIFKVNPDGLTVFDRKRIIFGQQKFRSIWVPQLQFLQKEEFRGKRRGVKFENLSPENRSEYSWQRRDIERAVDKAQQQQQQHQHQHQPHLFIPLELSNYTVVVRGREQKDF